MGNFMHFTYQSPTAANAHNNVSVPLVGALDRPAGTYDVVVKCQGLGQFNQLYTLWSADLSVTAQAK